MSRVTAFKGAMQPNHVQLAAKETLWSVYIETQTSLSRLVK